MRRRYSIPAAYLRHVESELVLLLAKVGRDHAWREDEDPRIRRFAGIPDDRVDAGLEGRVTITIDTEGEIEMLVDPAAGLTVPADLRVAS